jgi:hypothetical protein
MMLTIVKLGTDDIHPDDKKGLMGSKFYIGALLLGFFKSPYSLSLSLAQMKEGALMIIDSMSHKYGKLDSFVVGSFARSAALDLSLEPAGSMIACSVESAAVQNYTANILGGLETRAREAFEAYLPYLFFHCAFEDLTFFLPVCRRYESKFHALWIARSGHDVFVGLNPSSHAAFTFVADMQLTNDIWKKWEPAALFAANSGNFQYTIFAVWPIICDTRLLQRTLLMSRVTWAVAETQPELISACIGKYSIKKDGHEAFYNEPETAQCFAKGLIAARLPHLVEEAELLAFLPAAQAQFADLAPLSWGTGLPLSLVCSLCAQNLEDKKQASTYAKAALVNLYPPKQTLAYMALGVAECLEE